ncbi:peptidoglycan-binding protein [Streptomyces polyrhachis]|uniref:Peptidoglycan-binding protein n=1 Tax=Streptomyces polyrhachis TaxID=1282885 RepID=A0ABW2GBR6_9ACTN
MESEIRRTIRHGTEPGPEVADLGLFTTEYPQAPHPGAELVRYEPPGAEVVPYRRAGRGGRGSHRAPGALGSPPAVLGALLAVGVIACLMALGMKVFQDTDRTTEVLPDPSTSAMELPPDATPSQEPSKGSKKAPPKDARSAEPGASTGAPSATPDASSRSAAPGAGGGPDPTRPGTAAAPPPAPAAPSAPPSAPATTGPPPPAGPTLGRGDTGAEVQELQLRLGQLGFYEEQPDGTYDTGTRGAVHDYQRSRGVYADPAGVYGPATRAALESETSSP